MKAIKYKTFSQAELVKGIALLAGRISRLQTDVQVLAVGVLIHAEEHGDYTAANRLVMALGSGIRRNSLVKWFQKFGGLELDKPEKGQESKGFVGWKGKEHIRSNLEKAKASLWYNAIKEAPVFTPYDINEKVQALLKEYKREAKKADDLPELEKKRNTFKLNDALVKQLLDAVAPQFEFIVEDEKEVSSEVPKVDAPELDKVA
jgi:hypothetical protein